MEVPVFSSTHPKGGCHGYRIHWQRFADERQFPPLWPVRSFRTDVLPVNFSARMGLLLFDAGTPITSGTWLRTALGADCGRTVQADCPREKARAFMRVQGSVLGFDAQMRVLAQRTEPLALHEFELRRRAGTLPARAVAVTFDDGYVDNLNVAVPLLNVHSIPATVFVAAGMIGTGREFWWDDVERIAFSVRALLGSPPALSIPWSVDDGAPFIAERSMAHWNAAAPVD